MDFEIIMSACDSTNVTAIGYNIEHKYLRMDFSNGKKYGYSDVPFGIYQALRDAPSKGSFHARHIKGFFKCDKLEDNA